MIASDLLAEVQPILERAGVPSPSRDARKLMRHLFEPGGSSLDLSVDLSDAQVSDFRKMVAQREARRPVSQILGHREFWGRNFKVTPDTLDPRPDSELIIETALTLPPSNRILDLGTGTGCLLLTLLAEFPKSSGIGVDISKPALKIARQNAQDLGLADVAQFDQSDWFSQVDGTYDLIVCNPPYISAEEFDELSPEVALWEPKSALTPGGDGLSVYRVLKDKLGSYLVPGGTAILEFGWRQADDLLALFGGSSFKRCEVIQDLNGKDRALVLQK